jgi:hypothetical protein
MRDHLKVTYQINSYSDVYDMWVFVFLMNIQWVNNI